MPTKMTKTICEQVTYPAEAGTKMFVLWDASCPGLGLRIYPSGRKSWVIQYRLNGRQRFTTLADYRILTLGQARDKAAIALGGVKEGEEPPQAKAEHGLTLTQLAGLYLEKWAKRRKRTWKEDERILNRDILPRLGNREAATVTRAEVRDLIERRLRDAPVGAAATFSVLRKMCNWAVENDYLDASPCANVRAPAPARRKDRVLSEEEIKIMWAGLNLDGTGRALRFILATAQRPGEAVSMVWEEVEGSWWTIPAAKAKNGKSHRVYLSQLALELMGARGKGQIFKLTGKHAVNSLSTASARFVKESKMKPWTPHDLRRTAASNLAAMGTARTVLGAILNHTDRSVTAIYDRHSYDEEKRQVLDKWVERLNVILS